MANFLQALEPRVLFAGDVTAEVVRGSLRIRGDGADNAIFIELDAVTGGVVVRGDAGTTVNGSAEPLAAAGLTGDVRVSLGDGADTLTVNGANLPGRLLVRGGGGDDAVTLSGSGFAGRVTLSTGRGHDAIRTSSCTFGRGLIARGGPGHDVKVVPVHKTFDFRRGRQGWAADFADYEPGEVGIDAEGQPIYAEEAYQFKSGLRPLPPELGVPGTGFLLSGKNLSDDLFMFLKRQLGPGHGIQPGQSYQVRFVIRFASNAPSGAVGPGGPPGEAVVLRAGARTSEPTTFVGVQDNRPYVLVTTEDGERGASLAGNIANGISFDEFGHTETYVSLTREHVHDTTVTADADGRLWLLVGTDSGYESTTALYYQRVSVTLNPVAAGAESQ